MLTIIDSEEMLKTINEFLSLNIDHYLKELVSNSSEISAKTSVLVTILVA